ncbi:MAG TPA: hypothetical protein VKH35_04170 [Thermoanaerobaculia bacterium]|jgi:hypothetical protein|nr:hypothetical protein [Thermoanaerobaculia bacterium]
MRRLFVTILMSSLLVSTTPLLRGEDPIRHWDPIRIIRKIVHHLFPSPTDGGDGLGNPKP